MSAAAGVLAGAAALVGWAYLGYPLLCFARARLAPRPIARRPIRPQVSVLVAAWRERATIEAKLQTLAAQSYPAELTEVIVACDGSDDGTPDEARAAGERLMPGRVKVIALPERRGKPAALNAALAAASGELLVYTDARQRLSEGAIERLVEDLGDPEVGVSGGRLELDGGAPVSAYWRYESAIRRWEGAAGSTVGVSGALYAIRRALASALPEETILDDVLVPARARLAGFRVAYQAEAVAFDRAAESGREFRRKVRTLSGNFQLCALEPRLLSPLANPAWLDFASHKLARLAVPWALLAALAASLALPWPWPLALAGPQLAGYALALARLAGVGRSSRLAGLAETFVVLNAAAAVALGRFLRHGRRLPW